MSRTQIAVVTGLVALATIVTSALIMLKLDHSPKPNAESQVSAKSAESKDIKAPVEERKSSTWSLPPASYPGRNTSPAIVGGDSLPALDVLRKDIESVGIDAVILKLQTQSDTRTNRFLIDALDLSRNVLREQPEQLEFQLCARTCGSPDFNTLAVFAQASEQSPLGYRFLSTEQAGGPLRRIIGNIGLGFLAIVNSPDGSRILTGEGNGALSLWDLLTGQRLWSVKLGSKVDGVAFSPDGKRAAAASDNVFICNVETGEIIQTFKVKSNGCYDLEFSKDGRMLAVGSDGFASKPLSHEVLTLFNMETGEKRVIEGPTLNVKSVCFSDDGKRLYTGCHDQTIAIWDTETAAELKSVKPFAGSVSSAVLSPDGSILATSSFFDPEIKLYDSTSLTLKGTLSGHRQGVTRLAFSHDGRYLASGGQEGRVLVWEVAKQRSLPFVGWHSHLVNSVCFSHDDRLLLSASSDKSVRLWDYSAGQTTVPLSWHDGLINAVALSPDGRLLATGGGNEEILIFDVKSGAGQSRIIGPFKRTTKIAFSPDSSKLVSLHGDRRALVFDVESGSVISQFEVPVNPDYSRFPEMDQLRFLSFSPDGRHVAVGGHSLVVVWDLVSPEIVQQLSGHTNIVNSLSFSANGAQLASASGDKTIRLWDTSAGKTIREFDTNAYVTSVYLTERGDRIFYATSGSRVRMMDCQSGKIVKSFDADGDEIQHLLVFENEHILVTVDFSGELVFWDIVSGERLDRYNLGERFRAFAGLSSDLLAGAGANGRIHVLQWTKDKLSRRSRSTVPSNVAPH